jgi:hypothetical protein
MKNLTKLLIFAGIISCNTIFAQKVDSTKTQKDSTKKADYFSKYRKKPSSISPQVKDTWTKKQGEKKVEFNYNIENGRVLGGETTIKLGKKNQ